MSNFIEGLSVSGEVVASMKDKTFTVLKGAAYREFPDLDNPTEKKRKLVLVVRLSDKTELDYLPNKESQKTMVALHGYDMDHWIGQKFEWEIREQKVFKEMKKVMYVLPKKFSESVEQKKFRNDFIDKKEEFPDY